MLKRTPAGATAGGSVPNQSQQDRGVQGVGGHTQHGARLCHSTPIAEDEGQVQWGRYGWATHDKYLSHDPPMEEGVDL